VKKILALTCALLLALGLTSCSSGTSSGAQQQGQQQTEIAFGQQSAAVPYPVSQLRDSLERRNVRERLLRQNNPNAIGYVYLLGDTGTYIGYYVIKGKVSSTQSQMTTDQLATWTCKANDGCSPVVVDAPGDDGSYGANEAGVYFFTVEGVMVTTDMRYIVSDAPLKVDAPKLNVPKV
jgi:hypothetical protein